MAIDHEAGPASQSGAPQHPNRQDAGATPAGWPAKLAAGLRRRAPWLRVLASAGLIFLVLQQASLSEIFALVGQSVDRWPYLLPALALPGIGAVFAAWRWKVLLGGLGTEASTFALFRAILVGTFFNSFLPSTIGGDMARSWWIQRTVGSAALSLTVVVLDRLIGLIGICAVGLLAAALRPSLVSGLPQLWVTVLIVAAVALLVTALGHPAAAAIGRRLFSLSVLKGLHAKAATAYSGFASLRRDKGRLVRAFLLSCLLQSTIILQFFVLSSALALDMTLWHFAILIPLVSVVTLLPITINGIGLREASLAVLGAGFGLGTENAVALAWMFLGFQFVYVLAGGLIYMLGRPTAR